MEQIKLFVRCASDTFDKLKSAVNEWLTEEGNGVEVVSCHVTSAANANIENQGFLNYTIVIFYRLVTK